MTARTEGPPPGDTETTRVRGLYEALAPRYDPLIAVAERTLFAGARQWACAPATGRVLDVAVGTGRNLPWYPAGVDVTGIDISPRMLDRARERARNLDRTAALEVADAQQMPFPDNSFDTVIATLALCSIPDDRAAVAEMARVLRPGGRLLLVEHVASPTRPVRAVQRLLDPLTVRAQGDHLLRQPDQAVHDAGLFVDELRRSRAGVVLRLAAHKAS